MVILRVIGACLRLFGRLLLGVVTVGLSLAALGDLFSDQ